MEVKLIEVRDRMTFIPAMAVRLSPRNEEEMFLLRRAGYGREQLTLESMPPYVMLAKLSDSEANYDPYSWRSVRTMTTAHLYIIEHWKELTSGDVVDVEFIMKETREPKRSERFGETNIVQSLTDDDRIEP